MEKKTTDTTAKGHAKSLLGINSTFKYAFEKESPAWAYKRFSWDPDMLGKLMEPPEWALP